MKKTIIAIVGRNSSGKSAIARKVAEKYGLKIVQSYTTRKPRPSEIEKGLENSDHIFVSDDEFDKLTDIVAYTEINGVRYCTTEEVLNNSDIYVIDPKGIDYLLSNFSKKYHLVQFLIRANDDVRKARFMSRGESEEAFDNRNQSENSQFSEYDDNHGYDIVIYNNNELEAAVNDISDYVEILLENLQAEKEFIEKKQAEASNESTEDNESENSIPDADIRTDNETDTDLVLDEEFEDSNNSCESASVDSSSETENLEDNEDELDVKDDKKLSDLIDIDEDSADSAEDSPFDVFEDFTDEETDIVIDTEKSKEESEEETNENESVFDMFKLDESDSFDDEDFEDGEKSDENEPDEALEENENTSFDSDDDIFSLDDDFESGDENESLKADSEENISEEAAEEKSEAKFDLESLIKDDKDEDDDDDDDDSPDEAILLD